MRLICDNCGKEVKKSETVSVDFQSFKKAVGIEGYENAYFCSLECVAEYIQKKVEEINRKKDDENEVLP